MNTLKKLTIGVILFTIILLFVGYLILFKEDRELKNQISDTNSIHLSDDARKLREKNLNESYPEENYEIQSEIIAGDTIISGATTSEGMGFYLFECEQGYKYKNYACSTSAKNKLSYFWVDEYGNSYDLFWILEPNIASMELTYFIDGEKIETLMFDTKEIICWKIPYEDCTHIIKYFDTDGNLLKENMEEEHINQRVLIDNTMYWNSGVTCEPVSEEHISGKVTSTVFLNHIPTKNGQSNFGIDHPYRIEEDCLKVCVFEQWYVFDKLWEVNIIASNVTEKGLSIMCSHKGAGIATNFHTNDFYWLEIKTSEGWVEVPIDVEVNWEGQPYFIEKNESVELKINWEKVYGYLQPGNYRIGKNIYWFDETESEFITQTCYAEFMIQ